MNTARKSFLLSLIFHALMGTSAFFVLTQMHTPPTLLHIPVRSMVLVSLSDSAPAPKQQEIADEMVRPVPPSPSKPIKPLITPPTLPAKALKPQPTAIPTQAVPSTAPSAVPLVSAPQQVIQHTSIAETFPAPSKPKIDTAAEMQLFKAALRTKIKQNLRYPTAARRRGIEGEVAIQFTVNNDGSIHNISVQYGEEIFYNAAKAAVASAEGINIPNSLIDSLPKEMDITLEFKLNS